MGGGLANADILTKMLEHRPKYMVYQTHLHKWILLPKYFIIFKKKKNVIQGEEGRAYADMTDKTKGGGLSKY